MPWLTGNLEQDGRLINRSAVPAPGMDRNARRVLPALRRAAEKTVRRVGLGHRGDEGASVGMNRLVDDLPRRTALDNRAQVHDRDTIREVAGGGDVVRDVEEGDAALVLETAQQVEDLHSRRGIDHRDWLVGHDVVRVPNQRAGDPDPLPLPP
ncbi:MAG: hypothetical protein K0S83_906 [Thermomicrobiales bacterium]|nr:hypothetical protein [Thermomicrobiales bacterium]